MFDPLHFQVMLLRSCYFIRSLHTRFATTSSNLNKTTLLGGAGEGGKGTVGGLCNEYDCLEPESKLRMVYKIISIGFVMGKYTKPTLA